MPRSLIASGAAILLALALGGCSYDYLQHTDRVGYASGDAVKANLESETTNPSGGSMYDTRKLGKDGNVIPASTGGTSSTAGSASGAAGGASSP